MSVDALIAQALRNGALRVEPDGSIWRPDGRRAETVDDGYGRVRVWESPLRMAMAHRVVWIAINGPIPPGARVAHANRRRHDNRPANLTLVHTRPRVPGPTDGADGQPRGTDASFPRGWP